MRKRIIVPGQQAAAPHEGDWLDLDAIAEVEITSEDPEHPIEAALVPGPVPGWRAGGRGEQTVRLVFPKAQRLTRILLKFVEEQEERMQEFVLRWSPDGGQSFREIVRQQWNFSPQGSTAETEDLRVDLTGVTVLELVIVPDTSRPTAIASLAELRLA